MCGPALAVPLMIASAAVTAGGQLYSASAQANAANYEAKVADRNAKLAADLAKDSQQATERERLRQYRQVSALKGQQEAALAANGVDLGFGSALQLQRDTAMIGAEDVAEINRAGDERTRGYGISALNYRTEAQANRYKASAAKTAGLFAAGSTILGGASRITQMPGAIKPRKNSYGVAGGDGIY